MGKKGKSLEGRELKGQKVRMHRFNASAPSIHFFRLTRICNPCVAKQKKVRRYSVPKLSEGRFPKLARRVTAKYTKNAQKTQRNCTQREFLTKTIGPKEILGLQN